MTRVCANCGEPMVRHHGESHRRFAARQTCGRPCANKWQARNPNRKPIRVEDVTLFLAMGVTNIPAALGVTQATFERWLDRHPDVTQDARGAMPKQDQSWWAGALCFGIDKFYDRDERWQKRVCKLCPVRNECLDYALSVETSYTAQFGVIWGGLSGTERAELIRGRELRTA